MVQLPPVSQWPAGTASANFFTVASISASDFTPGEIDMQPHLSRGAKMRVRIVEARKDIRACACRVERMKPRLRSGQARDFFCRSCCQHFARANGNRFDDLRLVHCKSRAGIDAAVEVNIVGRRFRHPSEQVRSLGTRIFGAD